MMSHSERASERRSLEVDLFRLNGFEVYFKFTRENNDWHMAVSGGGGVKYHSLSYWSIFMSSPVEFLIGEFRILENGITNQEKK